MKGLGRILSIKIDQFEGDTKVKVIKTASGRNKIKLSRKEWEAIGKKAGWLGEGRGANLPKRA